MRRGFAGAASLCFVAAFAIISTWNLEFIFNSHLWADDAIFLGKASLGQATGLEDPYSKIWALFAERSLALAKLLPIALRGMVAALVFAILREACWDRFLSAGLATGIALLPIAVDQFVFVNGSHPTAGLVIGLSGVAVLPLHTQNSVEAHVRYLTASLLIAMSSLVTPVFSLAALVSLSILAVGVAQLVTKRSYVTGAIRRTLLVSHSLLFTALSLQVINRLSGSRYHYDELPGWVDYSLAQVFRGLRAIFTLGWPSAYTLVLIWCIAAASAFYRTRPSMQSGRLSLRAWILFSLAAVASAPVSVVTSFVPRYRVAPVTLLVVLVVLLLSGEGAGSSPDSPRANVKRPPLLLHPGSQQRIASIFVVVAISITAGNDLRDATAGANIGFRHVENAVSLVGELPDGPWQIIVILPDEHRMTTNGYNHWSTWQLRALIGNTDVIGIIAATSDLQRSDPNFFWVDRYQDHSRDDYWGISGNGRAFRRTFIGVERDRPTYVFLPDDESAEMRSSGLLTDVSGSLALLAGGASTPVDSIETLCEGTGGFISRVKNFPTFSSMWAIDDVVLSLSNAGGEPVSGDVNRDATAIYVVTHSFTRMLPFTKPNDAAKYSATRPEMPFLTSDLAAYDGESISVALRGSRQSLRLGARHGDQEVVTLIACPTGSGIVFSNSGQQASASSLQVAGTYTAGAGFLERVWSQGAVSISVGLRHSTR